MKQISFITDWLCNGQPVTLPHDAQISEKRGKDVSNGGHGYFPGGVYTYEKIFTAPAACHICMHVLRWRHGMETAGT